MFGAAIEGAVNGIVKNTFGKVFDRLAGLIPDKDAREKFQRELEMAALQAEADIRAALREQNLAQSETNKIEAANPNLFISGWRPFIGWVCGAAFAWTFLGAPVARWACAIWAPQVTLPEISMDGLAELTFGMLGLGGLRTFEKTKRVAAR